MNKKRLLTVLGGSKERRITISGASFEDTFLNYAAATTNYSNDNYLSLRYSPTSAQRNIIIKPDLSGIPSGATIISAKLNLFTQEIPITIDSIISIYPILAANSDMVFSQMAWNIKKTGTAWAGDVGSDGGDDGGCFVSDTDYSSIAIATFVYPFTASLNTLQTVDLNLTVFASLIANNYGLLITGSRNATHGWHSTQSATPGYRPSLVVKYK